VVTTLSYLPHKKRFSSKAAGAFFKSSGSNGIGRRKGGD